VNTLILFSHHDLSFHNPTGCSGNGGTTSCSSATVTGLIVFEAFSFLWTSEVLSNVCLATLSGGVFGGWYYFGASANEGGAMVRKFVYVVLEATFIDVCLYSQDIQLYPRLDEHRRFRWDLLPLDR
jgi:hypothetical protein